MAAECHVLQRVWSLCANDPVTEAGLTERVLSLDVHKRPQRKEPGRMFWLWWKTLSGSYVVFTFASRS